MPVRTYSQPTKTADKANQAGSKLHKIPPSNNHNNEVPPKQKTCAELDQELRDKLEALSGDGGSAGVEYENGKAEGLKRSVKNNMFRYI